jgi:hypothetical protein
MTAASKKILEATPCHTVLFRLEDVARVFEEGLRRPMAVAVAVEVVAVVSHVEFGEVKLGGATPELALFVVVGDVATVGDAGFC